MLPKKGASHFEAIRGIPLFHGLSESELEAVRPCLREKTFQKGETLFLEGKSCERVFFVRTGRVKLYRISSEGREQILEMLGPGDTCACNPGSSAWSCSSSAEALTPCAVLFLSRDDYIRMVQTNSKVAHALNEIFAKRIQCFSSLIEEISLKDSKKRLVKFLLDMLSSEAQRSQQGRVLLISFTREEIAQRIGMARETVARQLYQLKRAKLIDIKHKQVIVLNEQNLRNLLS